MKLLPTSIFAIYLLVLIKLILIKGSIFYQVVPTSRTYIEKRADSTLRTVNAVPFATIKRYMKNEVPNRTRFYNIGGNVILFIPYGFLLPLLFKRRIILFDVFYSAAIVSFCFELTQFVTGTGQFDVDDILLNTLGGVCGYLLWMPFKNLLESKKRKPRSVQRLRI